MEIETKQEIRYTVILPVDLDNKVQQQATEQRRSKAQQIAWILEKHFNKEQEQLTQATTNA